MGPPPLVGVWALVAIETCLNEILADPLHHITVPFKIKLTSDTNIYRFVAGVELECLADNKELDS
ncbi:hypothetical protein P3T76_004987 [Phytophthora citrophthora]|uniref:Uncharacterized protein n=1 Tax=Phytophthora citrophthora TaxID=4793 RepID=A0AAD9GSX8_9STRA|nr:hypothetical protein P3T76_004987 [Phytophthora citrophthora]